MKTWPLWVRIAWFGGVAWCLVTILDCAIQAWR